jgi:polyisoprenoid-binding protein YceI
MRRFLILGLLAVLAGPAGVSEPRCAWGQKRRYQVAPEASVIRVLVYRSGLFSVLAHDHVLVALDAGGHVMVDSQEPARSQASIRVGSAAFDVDPPEERERAGFTGELTEGNRRSILEVATGAEVLDAARWPAITATSGRITGTPPELMVEFRVAIRGRERVVSVPVRLELAPDRLRARGEIALLQSDFGITPYATLLGTIAVEDRIVVQFDVTAVPQP